MYSLIIILPLIMFSGLAAAPLITALFLYIVIRNYRNLNFLNLRLYIIEYLFLIWGLITCLWSPAPLNSFLCLIRVSFIIILGFIICINARKLSEKYKNTYICLLLGLIISIGLFFIEYTTSGLLSMGFRLIFQSVERQYFSLYFLDRGCAFLSVITWIVIGYLAQHKRYFPALGLYILVMCLLYLSDSLTSLLAFAISGITFIILTTSRFRVSTFLTFSVLIGSISVMVFSYYHSPFKAVDTYLDKIPMSGKHRLFIWNFVANKAAKRALLGYGFNSSRNVVTNENLVRYRGYEWSTLPMHPHNNILQIWLEMGIIGSLLMLSILYKVMFHVTNDTNLPIVARAAIIACFINYYVIGTAAFNVWQLWWISTGVFCLVMITIFKYQVKNEHIH